MLGILGLLFSADCQGLRQLQGWVCIDQVQVAGEGPIQAALSALICFLSPNFSLGMKGPICRDSLNFFMLGLPSFPEVPSPPYGLYLLYNGHRPADINTSFKTCLCKNSETLWRQRGLRALVLTLLTLFACESCPARALPSDVVAVGSVLALAHIGTVLSIKSSWATFQQSKQGKS